MKYRLRSNCKEELDSSNLQGLLDSFELRFRGGDKNEPFLQTRGKEQTCVECIYIQNTPENREQWFPSLTEYNLTLSVATNKKGETEYWHSARNIEYLQKPYCGNMWFAIDCTKHKDYLPMLAARQAKQKQQAIEAAIKAQKLHNDTLAQIEQLRALAESYGLTLALDYITSLDKED